MYRKKKWRTFAGNELKQKIDDNIADPRTN